MSRTDSYYDWQKMTLLVTNRCNLVCKMCGIITQPKQTIPREIAFHCADFAEREGFEEVEISGGEPTLVPYFWDLLDRLCAIGCTVKVTTNAVRHQAGDADRFAQYPNLAVQVSIDGVENVHDDIRGAPGAFARTEKSLHELAEKGVRLSLNTVVQSGNYDNMVETYERFKHLPLDFHAFSLIEVWDFNSVDAIPRDKCGEVIAVLKELQLRSERDGREVVLSDELLDFYRRRVKYPYFIMHQGEGCTVVKKSVFVNQYSVVMPCHHYGWPELDESRSLHFHTLDDIVNSAEYRGALDKAVGPGGCVGCNTMCYNWDEEFREKVMNPSTKERVRRAVLCAKEHVRMEHPDAFHVARGIGRKLGVGRPPLEATKSH